MHPHHPKPPLDRSSHSANTSDKTLETIIKRIHRSGDLPAISTYLIEINK
jgi:hypothetical protein